METHPTPGTHEKRNDTAEIPAGRYVDFQGPGRNRKTALELISLEVNGALRSQSSKTPIEIETDSTIIVGAGGSIAGVSPGAGGKVKQLPITLTSKEDSIGIHGRVESEGGPTKIKANGAVTVSGIVNAWESTTSLESDTGSVKITGGGIVAACGNVDIDSAPKKPTIINCRVHSRVGNVIINGKQEDKNPGDVSIGKGDTVSAYREVKIYADSLYIGGTILANTIQKFARVTVLDTTGHIKGKLKTKNKIDTVQVAKEKTDGRAGEESNDCRITGLDGATIDFRASPGAIDAGSYTRLAVGTGGTLDLRGNYPGWAVVTCPGPIEIFADNVLLEPGVPIEAICGPGPVLVNPSAPVKDVAVVLSAREPGYPAKQVTVEALVTNMGNTPDTYGIAAHDLDGWPIVVSTGTVTLHHSNPMDTIITVTLDVPGSAVPGVDTNYVVVDVASLTDPTVLYSETTFVAVRDSNLLREFSLSPFDTVPGLPEDTALVYHWLMNIGELHDDYLITVDDSLGWEVFPDSVPLALLSTYDSIFCTRMVVPAEASIGDVNKLYINVESTIDTGTSRGDTVEVRVQIVTAVDDRPPVFHGIKHSVYPNPFNPHVTIRFTVPSSTKNTVIEIFDVKGRRVRTVFDGRLRAGGHKKTWDGRNASGDIAASGIYFYRIRVGQFSATGKLAVVR